MRQLLDLKKEIMICKLCNCSITCTNKVIEEGNPLSNIMFIGEYPNEEDDIIGLPFQGKNGKLLDKFIDALGLNREDIYISYVVKCKPVKPQNIPSKENFENCKHFLFQQIMIVKPKIIVCFGQWPSQILFDSDKPIGQLRGHVEKDDEMSVISTYNPNYLIRNPSGIKPIWEDMKLVLDLISKLDYIVKKDSNFI